MSIKLRAKTALFQVLDRFPEKLGYSIYHLVQEKLGDKSIDNKIKASQATYSGFERITKELEIVVRDKTILEIGSGWLPLMPYFFKYFGRANKVLTYDLNKHYNPRTIQELNRSFSKKFKKDIQNNNNKYHLPKEIEYHPETNIAEMDTLNADIVFSRFVLEHVKPSDLKKMHEKFKESLKPGSYIIHFISPSDHRAYLDKSLSLQDFLRYSEIEWSRIQTKFDYHNRWRLPQYLELFKALNYEIVHLEFDYPEKESEAYKKFKAVPLHSAFKDFSDEELMAGSINIILKV